MLLQRHMAYVTVVSYTSFLGAVGSAPIEDPRGGTSFSWTG
jgi:hypothetical protein